MTTQINFDKGGYHRPPPGRHPSGRACRSPALTIALPVLPLLLTLFVVAVFLDLVTGRRHA